MPKMTDQPQPPMTLVGQQHCLALFGSLAHNHLGPQGGAILAEALKGNTTLTSLECASMPCTCHMRKVLGLVDQRQQPLTLVGQHMSCALLGSLGGNKLGPEGGAALSEGLKGNTTLTELKCVAMPRACQIRKVLSDQRGRSR